jgi:hypothetical protein
VRRFAANTSVPVDRSRAEIERVLTRYGASGFGYQWERRLLPVVPPPLHGEKMREQEVAAVMFQFKDRRVRLDIPMPEDQREVRQRWRAVLLVIKAKLEAVASGISTLEAEFLANLVTENGMTIGQVMLPRLSEATKAGRLLPAAGGAP